MLLMLLAVARRRLCGPNTARARSTRLALGMLNPSSQTTTRQGDQAVMKRVLALVLVASVIVTGCAPTVTDLRTKYHPDVDVTDLKLQQDFEACVEHGKDKARGLMIAGAATVLFFPLIGIGLSAGSIATNLSARRACMIQHGYIAGEAPVRTPTTRPAPAGADAALARDRQGSAPSYEGRVSEATDCIDEAMMANRTTSEAEKVVGFGQHYDACQAAKKALTAAR
jgi:hypothetical protein